MSLVEKVHRGYAQERRVRVLSEILDRHLPPNSTVLDVGSGDGQLAHRIQQRRPDLRIRGVDVLVREKTFVPVAAFDGKQIPEAAGSYDLVMLVDVLHHTSDPMVLLREAARVASKGVVIKDHLADGFLARPLLKWMDRIGNARYRVALPYNYWPEKRWQEAFRAAGLAPRSWERELGLYPWPACWILDRHLHFVTRLSLCRESE